MEIKMITPKFGVHGQIVTEDLATIKDAGFQTIVCNRPDGEGEDQTDFKTIQTVAEKLGLTALYLPVQSGLITDKNVADFEQLSETLAGPVLAYCKSGTRAASLWALGESKRRPISEILAVTKAAGYDLNGLSRRLINKGKIPMEKTISKYDILIVGAGAAGIAFASSLQARKSNLSIAVIDPADVHYYQPGWTMVGGGIFEARQTAKTMASLIPNGVQWIKSSVAAFEPAKNAVVLDDSNVVSYDRLVVCPGLKLDWDAVEGLSDTLGRNGVTSNYRFDLAPYTWDLVQGLNEGKAIFTQPPMPIKCAGAPQKALYLSGDAWHKKGRLKNIDISFMNAGGVLFGVKDYVPVLEKYIQKYGATVNLFHNLIAVDGHAKKATFKVSKPDKDPETVTVDFDMLHVCPPQTAPDCIRVSPLADAVGWVDVDQGTLRHKSFDNIWSLGDVMNAPNAKTAAAARKQAPTVAENIVADINGRSAPMVYDGYGSCPLTVERGKIVLAEFGYGGALKPSFPKAVLDGTKPTRAAWFLKEKVLPPIYWNAMLKGREWLAKPKNA